MFSRVRSPSLILPFVSMATTESSTSLTNLSSLGWNAKSLPDASMPTAIDAFGAMPLNGAAYALSRRPGSGTGLLMASRTSGDAFSSVDRARRRRWLALWRVVALAEPDVEALAFHSYFNLSIPAIAAIIGRVIPQHVVVAAVGNDAVPRFGEVVHVHRRIAAGVFAKRAQALLLGSAVRP